MIAKEPKENSSEMVALTHVFDAGWERVFSAWTDPEQLVRWYAPDGCSIRFKSIDVREGGSFHSCVQDPVHGDCWCKGTYLELKAPERLVFTMVVTNEQGDDLSPEEAGMPADWPVLTKVTVTFTSLGNKTEILLQQTVPAALARQTGALPSWIRMFNRLNQLL
ncbi:SRPBCC family protein [Niabella aurantiaca]|uniref:SRPBCC family protein n=1 Tax=Niabella aurantiaca TaxID=379900 RepID=UPI0012F926CD|nr:SRPBCC domain-containing protein [Niabella aurantiaca]